MGEVCDEIRDKWQEIMGFRILNLLYLVFRLFTGCLTLREISQEAPPNNTFVVMYFD